MMHTCISSPDRSAQNVKLYICTERAQNFENYKYTFNTPQFLYKNGLYIVIIMIFIALCIITPFVKNTQLLYNHKHP